MKRQLIAWFMLLCLLTACGSGGQTGEDSAGAASSAQSPASGENGAAQTTGQTAGAESAEDSAGVKISPEGITLGDETLAGWHIVVEQVMTGASMKNVSVDLGYTDLETSEFVKEASEGNTFYAVKLAIEKSGGTELLEWAKMILSDSEGNQYQRIDDAFIADLGLKHMSGSDLNFGSNEGWIVYEIPRGSGGNLEYLDDAGRCPL